MAKNDKPTRLARLRHRSENHPVVAGVLLLTAIVGGIAALANNLDTIYRVMKTPFTDDKIAERVADLLKARKAELENVRFQVRHAQSCTNGRSGRRKQATLSAQCPNFAIRGGDPVLQRLGGCYGPYPTENGATATISQTGVGRSECTLVVTCKLSDAAIAKRNFEDSDLLKDATESNLEFLRERLSPISFPDIHAPGVECRES